MAHAYAYCLFLRCSTAGVVRRQTIAPNIFLLQNALCVILLTVRCLMWKLSMTSKSLSYHFRYTKELQI
jgi:hypothetical protein